VATVELAGVTVRVGVGPTCDLVRRCPGATLPTPAYERSRTIEGWKEVSKDGTRPAALKCAWIASISRAGLDDCPTTKDVRARETRIVEVNMARNKAAKEWI
jgi:hypothetical protein